MAESKNKTSLQGSITHSKRLRVVLYSHNTMGLGHFRRNLLIAQGLSASALNPDILMLAGVWEAGSLIMPSGVECIILPALYKTGKEDYRSRRLRITLPELVELRSKVIFTAVTTFRPDVFIVDNVPRGACHELDSTLEYLHSHANTICILGLRDVLDDIERVRQEWEEHKNEQAIKKYYRQVWVYGDSKIYDLVNEYGYPPQIAEKFRFTGYLDQSRRLELRQRSGTGLPCPDLGIAGNHFVMCMVGGGQDGEHLAEMFVKADLPPGLSGVLITGPHMDPAVRQQLFKLAADKVLSFGDSHQHYNAHLPAQNMSRPRLRIFEFVPEPAYLLRYADCVISMGGYNAVSEVLSFGKSALIVPRIAPRKEQLVRAVKLQEKGIIDMLHPDKLSPQSISKWLSRNIGQPVKEFRDKIDMQGLTRIPQFLRELLKKNSPKT